MTLSTYVRALAVMSAIAAGVPVQAQSRLVVKAALSREPATTWLFDLPSQRLEWSGEERLINGVFTATGRYFVATKEVRTSPVLLQLWIADLATGGVWTRDLPGYNGAYVVPNPRRDEAYVLLASVFTGSLVAVNVGGMRTLRTCDVSKPAVSRDGARLFCQYRDQLVTVDTATGTTLSEHEVGQLGVLATDDTGATVAIVQQDRLTVYDTSSGAVLRSALLPLSPGMTFSRTFGDWSAEGHYFVHGRSDSGRETRLVDTATLTSRQTLPLPPDREVLDIVVTPDGTTALVTSRAGIAGVLEAIDLRSNQVTFTTAQFSRWPSVFLALSSAPLAPVNLRADVAGRRVRLSWAIPASSDGVAHFVVEAGHTPGRTDVAFQLQGAANSLELSDVPRGRYFVRLRAVNITGRSSPTEDIVVEVQ